MASAPTTQPATTLEYPDPTATQVNLSCLDFLLIELVPMAYRITNDLVAREEEWINGSSSQKPSRISDDASSAVGTIGGVGVTGTVDEEESREAVFHRLETLGYRVGLGVVERFSRTAPRPTTPLDAIKFLCKDLWTLLFRKQIDNLKTNHRGIYVLTDNAFTPLRRMSFDTKKFPPALTTAAFQNNESVVVGGGVVSDVNGQARVQPFLYFPAGVIRGCLKSLGIDCTVTAECGTLPAATFQIRTVGAKN